MTLTVLLKFFFRNKIFMINNDLFNVLQINEYSHDYTQCENKDIPGTTCAEKLESIGTNNSGVVCRCDVTFTLDKDFEVIMKVHTC